MAVLAQEAHGPGCGLVVDGDVHAPRAVRLAGAVGGELGVVVEEGYLGLVGAREEAGVVLPAHGEQWGEGVGALGRVELGEVVALAAQGPDDVAGLAIDQVDGVGVADGNQVVPGLRLHKGVSVRGSLSGCLCRSVSRDPDRGIMDPADPLRLWVLGWSTFSTLFR